MYMTWTCHSPRTGLACRMHILKHNTLCTSYIENHCHVCQKSENQVCQVQNLDKHKSVKRAHRCHSLELFIDMPFLMPIPQTAEQTMQ